MPFARYTPWLAASSLLALCGALGGPDTARAQAARAPDTFKATTTGMTPEGLVLTINVVEWSDDERRAAVISALASEEDVPAALAELPAAGVVWRSGSAVGHTLKYAHRMETADGAERLTFVTDKPLDSYSFQDWTVTGGAINDELEYTVIELRLDREGNGAGTLSWAANLELDQEARTVTLADAGTARTLLTGAAREPKPYWARDD